MKTPFELTQLVLVRRDMPLAQALFVQGGHAIGKATYMQALKLAQDSGMGSALNPAWGHPYRMWCGVQNEKRLREMEERIKRAGLLYETVVEPDDESGLKGQMTALATFYYENEQLLPLRGDIAFDLKPEHIAAFKDAAIALVVKQLSAQLPRIDAK